MSKQDPTVTLGYISGVHGIKGLVKVYSYTDPMEAILDYQPWLMGEERKPVRFKSGKKHGKTIVVGFSGMNSPEEVKVLINQPIAVKRSQLPDSGDSSYYWTDLVGLKVTSTGGESLGRIVRMLETGAHDVMVVNGEAEHLIPFVIGQYVSNVDLEAGTIEVDWDPEF